MGAVARGCSTTPRPTGLPGCSFRDAWTAKPPPCQRWPRCGAAAVKSLVRTASFQWPQVALGILAWIQLPACSAQDQRRVFTKWLQEGRNMENTECQLIISKSTSAEVKSGKEELTLRDMIERGFSESPDCKMCKLGGLQVSMELTAQGKRLSRS